MSGSDASPVIGTGEQYQVALRSLGLGGEKDVAGPLDLAALPFAQPNRGPVGLEVEELLGVYLRDDLGVQRFGGGRERGRRRTGSVIPAGECTNQDRRTKLRGLPLPHQRVH